MFNSSLSPADAIALSGNDGGFGNGSSWLWFIVIIALLGGWGGNGMFGGRGGVQQDYVLTSDIATIERKLDEQNSGICNLGYTEAQLINNLQLGQMQNTNAIQTQLADCCCTQRSEIKDVNYNVANVGSNIVNKLQECCCDTQKQFMQTNYNLATQNCATLQAIDKVGDRIIDYLNADKAQTLRDENQALRLQASQSCQNQYLINALRPTPIPAYPVQNPYGFGYYGYGTTIS